MAVNQALQGPADTAAASMPGGPITGGLPFTGGVKGFQMQGLLDKEAMRQQQIDANQQIGLAKIQGASDKLAAQQAHWNDTTAIRKQLADQQAERDKNQIAQNAMNNATKQFQGHSKDALAYTTNMGRYLAAAAAAPGSECLRKSAHYDHVDVSNWPEDGIRPSIPQYSSFSRPEESCYGCNAPGKVP